MGGGRQVWNDLMNLGACPLLNRSPLTGIWYRAIQGQHWNTLNRTAHTRTSHGRFNGNTLANPGFEVVYFAENSVVALLEAQAVFGAPAPGGFLSQPRQNWIIINVSVVLQDAADLTDVAEHTKLQTSAQELTGDWKGYLQRVPTHSVPQPQGLAPTHELGRALFNLPDLEGFQAVSARVPYHRTLAVIPQKLQAGSTITFVHPATGQTLTIPP